MSTILSQDITKEWGLESLPATKQKEMVDRISKMLYQIILSRSLDILSEKEQGEFDLLLNENTTTPAEVLLFLQSKIPTFEAVVAEEKKKLKESLSVSASS